MRRALSIPDPIRYLLLVNDLHAGWAQVQPHLQGRLSLSRPRRDHTGHRAYTFRIAFSGHSVFRAQVRAGARYIVRADINQFYPSLYTHAIPWGIHGKVFAKANRGNAHIGNLIDERVRNGQDGQTMGIPIGPDTSFLLAEALLGSFDAVLVANLGNRPGLRVMDEYEFAFGTHSEAEEGIAILQDQLAAFELSLNPRKTAILECPVPLDPPWLIDLQTVPLPNQGWTTRSLLVAFVDRAFELAHRNRGESVINWAVSRLMSLDFTANQWRIVEPLVLQAAASEPGALPRCLRLILRARLSGLTIDVTRLHYTLGVTLLNAVRRGHGSEASWAVWGHILFSLPLDAAVVTSLATMNEDVVALVTLDARARGLIPPGTQFPLWEANLTPDGLRDGHWLVAYEATLKGWLQPPGPNPVTANQAYNHLAANNVFFYQDGDPEALTLAHKHSAPSWMTAPQAYLQ